MKSYQEQIMESAMNGQSIQGGVLEAMRDCFSIQRLQEERKKIMNLWADGKRTIREILEAPPMKSLDSEIATILNKYDIEP